MSDVLEEILREIERLRREVDALRCLDQPTLTNHTHTQAESHYSPDTDAAPTSLHHTVGGGANQSAAGNHSHTLSALGGNLTQARSHDSPDTNGSAAALHHTLGTGAYQAAAGNHTHTQAQSHNSADTDTATTALHHTLGTGAYQASAGNHSHTLSALGGNLTQARSHDSADTDGGAAALHHTLGGGANQAAAGNHTHPASSSIIKIGTVNATNGGVAVAFSPAFPNSCSAVVLEPISTIQWGTSVANVTNSGFTAYVSSGPAVSCYWIAFGT